MRRQIFVFQGEVEGGRNDRIQRQGDHGDDKRPGYSWQGTTTSAHILLKTHAPPPPPSRTELTSKCVFGPHAIEG